VLIPAGPGWKDTKLTAPVSLISLMLTTTCKPLNGYDE
jgi:hypothetical protein